MAHLQTEGRDSGYCDGGVNAYLPDQTRRISTEVTDQSASDARLVSSGGRTRYNQEQCGCSKCRDLTNHVNDDLLYISNRVQEYSASDHSVRQMESIGTTTGPGMVSPAQTGLSPTDSEKEVVVLETVQMDSVCASPKVSEGTRLCAGK